MNDLLLQVLQSMEEPIYIFKYVCNQLNDLKTYFIALV